MIKRLMGTCVLVLGVFVFAGPAFAGSGNGNGKGNDGSPGNSANAPGQLKKEAPTASDVGAATTTTAGVAQGASVAAPTDGVKPSNDTSHDTHAAASSNETKKYGNGQTAGAIAMQNGAPPSTVLHGPGNSQPHKVASCGGGHEVDVHALKGRSATACGGTDPQPGPGPAPTPKPAPKPTPKPAPKPAPTPSPQSPGNTPSVAPSVEPAPGRQTSIDPPKEGRQKGSRARSASHQSRTARGHAVLYATQRVGRPASLPFTGQRLWIAALLGVLLIATGLCLRQIRTSEPAVGWRDGHPNGARDAAAGAGRLFGRSPRG